MVMVTAQNNATTSPVVTPISAPTSVVPTENPSTESNHTCLNNLTEINVLIKSKDPFIEETYVLCPNTVYDLTDGGMEALTLRSNCIFKCGNNGKATDSCVIFGGLFHLLSSSSDFGSENKVGIIVQGITFDSGFVACALLVAPGDVTFIDCIFQV
jgi:hypothetical protein